MKTRINSITSKPGHALKTSLLLLVTLAAISALTAGAADIHWIGATGSYTNAASWDSNSVPTAADNAINANGLANVVQINSGDPDWTVNDLSAGGAANASGAIVQNSQTVNVNGWLHIADGLNSVGVFTLNGGILNVPNGRLFLCEAPGANGTLNIIGGVINKSGDVFVVADGGWNGSGARTGTVNQAGGTNNVNSELWLGQVAPGVGIYNLSGGVLNANNWTVVGRGGGTGTINMTGGTINRTGNGNAFIVGSEDGGSSVGTLNFSAGTINSAKEFWVGNGGAAVGTNNMSGTAVLNVDNWIAIGRGGIGVLNISGGSLTKNGDTGNHITIGGNGTGIINQTGGFITNITSETWVGENGTAIWNLNGGKANLSAVHIGQNGSATGTLNVNGGSLTTTELTTGNSVAVSTLNLNGGTIQAATSSANFLHDILIVQVQSGGAIFDSQGFNITIPQALPSNGDGSGGLTKTGSGTLTLSGANSYAGATVVSGGKLITTTASTAGGDVTVATGAGFGVTVVSANAQFNAANMTFASSPTTFDVDLNTFGNPTLAPLNVVGTLAVNGTVTINIADALPQLGQFPLVKYGTKTGVGFTLGSLPTGVTASISNNVANNSIDLVISGVNQPRWEGNAGGNWDIGVTTNWINIGTSQPTFYTDGSPVLFNDSALGTTLVNLTTSLHPNSVSVVNSNLNYTFFGSGSIAGSIGLTKQGIATLSVLNNNSYTGPTVISGGILSITNLANGGSVSPIGASSANPTNLVINSGATLQYAGPPVSVNRGYQANSGIIDAEGDITLTGTGQTASGTLVKIGPGKMTYAGAVTNVLSPANVGGAYQVNNGTVVFDGSSGTQSNRVVGEMWVGGTPATGGNVVLTNTILSVGSWFAVGRGNGTINNTSTATLYNSRVTVGNVSLGYDNGIGGNLAQQFLTLNGSSSLTNFGDMNLCESAGSTATISVGGTSILWGQNRFFLPNSGGATGAVTVANSGRMVVNNGWFSIGNGNNGSGSVLLKDSGSLYVSGDLNVTDTGTSTATFSVQDSAQASGNTFLVAKNGGTVATATLSGGTITARGGDTQIGGSGSGTMNQTGGTLIGTNWISIGRNGGGVGVYNLSGGSLIKVNPNGTRLNVAENGTGTLNVSGTGNVVVGLGGFADLDICSGNGNGTINLNGGTISAGQVTHLGSGTATFNFNGGTLIASPAASSTFMSGLTAANVQAGGAVINSGANVIGITQPLLDGTGGGGLTKIGSGTLYLNGANTYTGSTLVSTGALGGSGIIAGPVNVASGATLAPGTANIGTLAVSNTLTLAAGSKTLVKVSLNGGVTNNDQVVGLTGVTYNGSLTVNNVGTNALTVGSMFQLFSASGSIAGNFSSVAILPVGTGTFNPATGILTITSVNPPVINPPVTSGGNLILSGTGGTPGGTYAWLTTTNLLNPIATWTVSTNGVFDSAGAFTNAFPVSLSTPARFYRFRTP